MHIIFILGLCVSTIVHQIALGEPVVGPSTSCQAFYHLRHTLDAYGSQEHRVQCGKTLAINIENKHGFSMQLYDGSNIILITGKKLNRTALIFQQIKNDTTLRFKFLQQFSGTSRASLEGLNSSTIRCTGVRQLIINLGGGSAVKSANIRHFSDFNAHLNSKCEQILQFFETSHLQKSNTDNEQKADKLADFRQLAILVDYSRTGNSADNGRDTEIKRHRRATKFILPGTNWCGVGNVSTADQTYGSNVGVDRCCHEHDRCNHTIAGFTTNYRMYNFRFHTVSHCECDDRFRTCLRALASEESDRVGNWFFNVLGLRCFVFRHERVCTKQTWYGKCLAYGTELAAELHNQLVY